MKSALKDQLTKVMSEMVKKGKRPNGGRNTTKNQPTTTKLNLMKSMKGKIDKEGAMC